jgi:hypothetical protein
MAGSRFGLIPPGSFPRIERVRRDALLTFVERRRGCLQRRVNDEVLSKANEAFSEVFYLWCFPFCLDGETLFY